jgi:hypothetical protein
MGKVFLNKKEVRPLTAHLLPFKQKHPPKAGVFVNLARADIF